MYKRAVEDLLKYCENPAHDLGEGAALAPMLLGRALRPSSVDDHADLVTAARRVLWAEIERLRRAHGVPAALPDDPAGARLQADIGAGHEPLRGLSMVWARHFDRLEPKQLITDLPVSKSTFYEWLSRGMREVEIVLQRTGAAHGAVGSQPSGINEHKDWVVDTLAGPASHQSPNGHATPPRSKEQRDGSTEAPQPTTFSATRRSEIHEQIVADTVMMFRDNAQLSVTNAFPEQSASTRSADRSELDRLQAALVVLLMLVLSWAMALAPRASIVILLVVGVWRVGGHTANAWRARRNKATETLAWHLALLVPWLIVLGLLIVVMRQLPSVLAEGLYSSVRFGLILRGLCVSVGMLILGAVDGLRWIHESAPLWGPWQYIRSHGAWVMLHRWGAVNFAWLSVGMLVVTFLLAGTF